ncbi:hypothetical protein BU16DRAFT_540139 [Lophium mytilinum]|uniref:Uncharacterized protein n=1 Tax=Lophium mytilinum TaxID=390894 RepID=A0A6A6QRV5_9PEZI|nr:hypothetical protein BU16DRAFT_540139 [Lophium mytilinum]
MFSQFAESYINHGRTRAEFIPFKRAKTGSAQYHSSAHLKLNQLLGAGSCFQPSSSARESLHCAVGMATFAGFSKGLEGSGATRVCNGDSPSQGPSWRLVGDSSSVAQDATRRGLVGRTGSATAAVSGVPRTWQAFLARGCGTAAALHRRLMRLGGQALLGPVGVPGRRK